MRSDLILAGASAAALMCSAAMAAEIVPTGPFRGVELRGGGHVTLRYGNEQRVNLIKGSTQFTRFRIKDGHTLEIDACNGDCPHHYDLDVEVVTPRIDSVAIEGGGHIVSEAGFQKEDSLGVAIDGGGIIDVRSIPSDRAEAAVNGGGDIRLSASGRLEAAVDGGGDIHYRGNPEVSSAVNGGGTVSKGD